MYFGTDTQETVSVMGTPAFMDFVESIQSEGVSFEHVPMGGGTTRQDSLIVEVDAENPDKDLDALDIPIPRLTRRFHRDFKSLDALDPAALGNPRLPIKPFTEEETREIVFKMMLDAETHHVIQLDGSGPADYRSVVAFFARQLLKELRLVGGYDVLYGKVKTFMREHLFAEFAREPRRPCAAAQPLRTRSWQGVVRLVQGRDQRGQSFRTAGTTRILEQIAHRDTWGRGADLPFIAIPTSASSSCAI